MTGLVDWCAERARMVVAFVVIAIGAGAASYVGLPKEGAPNIDIPVLYVSVPLPGVSAPDAERLIVRPLEQELRGLEALKDMTGIASRGHAAVMLEFDFEWDKQKTLADVRDKIDEARAEFPDAAEEPVIREINLSQFPILVVALSGDVPERTLIRLANDLQREVEAVPAVLEAALTGDRAEMIEVVIDPLRLESYGITAQELLMVVDRNNRLVAADEVRSGTGAFSVAVPGAFETPGEVADLPVKVKGDRVVRLSDIADIRRTFEDRDGLARRNGQPTVALQVSKRVGENIIGTVRSVREAVEAATAAWPAPLKAAVSVDLAMDESRRVRDMVDQLESAVITAVILVMLVVLVSLGVRSSLLVGLAIPCSFLLAFALMASVGMSINNMTMFGLILAVGMLVDGAIVVVEYADKRIAQGQGPMRAYTEAARRMFWPITASTATTLCAFLPMLFWPGIPGEFMGHLPITLIFVLSASLIVALVFLPVLGGVSGRLTRLFARPRPAPAPAGPRRRTPFGRVMALVVATPLGPVIALAVVAGGVAGAFTLYAEHQNGVEFFVETEPERAIIHVRARGNLSLAERDRLVRAVERRVIAVDGVETVFAFTGEGGIQSGAGGEGPKDAVGQVQIELASWRERGPGAEILAEIDRRLARIPGVIAEIEQKAEGPQQGKPVQLRLSGGDWEALQAAAATARARFEATPGLVDIDDTRPLPGIEWEVRVDRAAAGRYGADVAAIGPLIQLVTRGATLDTMRLDDAEDEIDIRARFPREARRLSTLDTLRISTDRGLVPLENIVTRAAVPKLDEISRINGERFFLVRADVDADTSDVTAIARLEEWIARADPFPAGVTAAFTGDREEQQQSQAFLAKAFAGALGLMFVILLAQFNSLYNAVLVLSAVVLSVAGVLIGMLVMGQKFSIIMTGTGIVALAGIVVNNNIVLIDTYQDHARRLDPLEAIIRTAEDRIRPVLLTTITTMAGLAPMMVAVSFDFGRAEFVWGAPTALWWVQLATAVVFGLGTATVLTLIATPAALALRVWVTRGGHRGGLWLVEWLRALRAGTAAPRAWLRDRRLAGKLRRQTMPEVMWEVPPETRPDRPRIRAAE